MKNKWKLTIINFLLLPGALILVVFIIWLVTLIDPLVTSNAVIAHDHMGFHSSWFEELTSLLVLLGFLLFLVWWMVRVLRFIRKEEDPVIKWANILVLLSPLVFVSICILVDYLT